MIPAIAWALFAVWELFEQTVREADQGEHKLRHMERQKEFWAIINENLSTTDC